MEIIMIRTLIRAMRLAHRAVIRANHAEEPDQRNVELGNLGSNLIIMAVISFAATILAVVQMSEKNVAYPTYLNVILSVLLGFIVVSGLTGITFGMFLLAMNNPARYHPLAMAILWESCVAAAFAIGILMALFSPS